MAVKLRDCYLYIAILVQLIAIASPQFITSLDISADQGNSNLFASVPPTVDPSFSSTNVPWTVVQPPQSQGQPLQQQDQNELPVLAQTQPSPNSPIVADTTFSSSDQLNQPPDQQNSLLTSTDTLQTIAEAACPQAPSKKAASLFRRIPPRICCPDVDPSDELFWGWRMDSPAKRGAYCCEGGSIEYAEIRTCVNCTSHFSKLSFFFSDGGGKKEKEKTTNY